MDKELHEIIKQLLKMQKKYKQYADKYYLTSAISNLINFRTEYICSEVEDD